MPALERPEPSAEQLRVAIENAYDGLVVIDVESRIVAANTAFHDLFGYRAGELVGRAITELMPEEMRGRHRSALGRYMASGERAMPWRGLRLPGLHRDGRRLELELSFGEAAGEPRLFAGAVREVTTGTRLADELTRRSSEDQRQRMEILHAISVAAHEEQTAEQVVGLAIDGLAARYPGYSASYGTVDGAGKLRLERARGGPHGAKLEGVVVDLRAIPGARERLLAARTHEVENMRSDARVTAFAQEAEASGVTAALRVVVRLDGASMGLLGLDSETVHNWTEDERLTLESTAEHLAVVLADLRERRLRREAETALVGREAEYRALLSHLSGMAYRSRCDEEESLEYASAGSLKLTGWSAEELVAARRVRFTDLVHRDDVENLRSARRAAAGTGVPLSLEYRITSADGSEKWVWDQGAAIHDPASPIPRIEGFITDITETVRLQRSVRESELMSAMGSLVAGVSHEVRNPLFAISAALDAFEQEFGARDEFATYLKVLRGQVERMTSLMGDLLEYGRPSHSDSREEPRARRGGGRERSPADLDAILAAAVDDNRIAAAKRGCGIEARILAPPGAALAIVDVAGMRSVFQNLIENAIQHSPAGSTISLGSRIEEERGIRSWLFIIEDQGTGFREEDLPRLYDPFFSRRRGGTGMGLPIVRKLVLAHRGDVVAGNREGGGARVVVSLPL